MVEDPADPHAVGVKRGDRVRFQRRHVWEFDGEPREDRADLAPRSDRPSVDPKIALAALVAVGAVFYLGRRR